MLRRQWFPQISGPLFPVNMWFGSGITESCVFLERKLFEPRHLCFIENTKCLVPSSQAHWFKEAVSMKCIQDSIDGFVLQVSSGECLSLRNGNQEETMLLINQISNQCAHRMNSSITVNNKIENFHSEAQVVAVLSTV